MQNNQTAAMPEPQTALAFFHPGLLHEQKIRRWLYEQFHSTAACPRCHTEPTKTGTAAFWDGKRVCCKNCGCWYQATTGTPLAGLKLSVNQIFLILVGIGLNLDNRTISRLVGAGIPTIKRVRSQETRDAMSNFRHDHPEATVRETPAMSR